MRAPVSTVWFVAVALCAVTPGVSRAQASAAGQAPATIAADPTDVASADAIVAALYDVISGPAGQKRNWDRFRSLFAPGARLIPTGIG